MNKNYSLKTIYKQEIKKSKFNKIISHKNLCLFGIFLNHPTTMKMV